MKFRTAKTFLPVLALALLVMAAIASFFRMSPEKQTKKKVSDCANPIWNDFKIFLINLDRAPERLAWFETQFAKSDLSRDGRAFERMPAVDGKTIANLDEFVSPAGMRELDDLAATGFRKRHAQLSIGAVGCALSHIECWRAGLESGAKGGVWIFEDDCVIPQDLLERVKCTPVPGDTDILLLGVFCLRCRGEGGGLREVKRFFGLHGYVVTRRGLEKLLARADLLPMSVQIDTYLSDLAERGDLVVRALGTDAVSQTQQFATSIQAPLKPTSAGGEWA